LLRGFAKQPIAKAFDRRTLCGSFPAYEVVGGRERHVQLVRQNKPSDRKFAIAMMTIFMMLWAVLVIIGSFFRGQGFNFVFPWNDGIFFEL